MATEFVMIETPWSKPLEDAIAAAPRLGAQLADDKALLGDSDFFTGKSLAELAREQGVGPVRDIRVFAGGFPDDVDVDELLAQLEELSGS